jgi:probable H4MPT-linked C1 transfer pathway protein
MTRVTGWDLGGANIKAASAEDGRITHVVQIACPIIADPSKFDRGVADALALLPSPALHAVTMTGELSDVFESREQGVAYLVELMRSVAAGAPLRIYAGEAGFLAPEDAKHRTREVASANWHAAAALIAQTHGDALLVDIGTTTTDIVPVKAGRVAARGHTDAERLTEGELVYTGVVRTPVMVIAQSAPFRGRPQRIAAERFATMADVFRLTGELPDDADPYPAADNRGKSMPESAARLARMLGRDACEAELAEWIGLARYFADCQLAAIEKAARAIAERAALAASAPVIGAGCGRFAAIEIAARLGRPFRDFAEIVEVEPETREMAARCAPAVAVALLAQGQSPRLAAGI